MKYILSLICVLLSTTLIYGQTTEQPLIRVAVIEVYPQYLPSYKTILQEEAVTSVAVEEGVIAIFPMEEKETPTQIKIMEIYRDQQAYEAHLQTPHFLKYKEASIPMVKSLKLLDMKVLDTTLLRTVFKKIPSVQ